MLQHQILVRRKKPPQQLEKLNEITVFATYRGFHTHHAWGGLVKAKSGHNLEGVSGFSSTGLFGGLFSETPLTTTTQTVFGCYVLKNSAENRRQQTETTLDRPDFYLHS